MLDTSSLGVMSGAVVLGAAGLKAAWGVHVYRRREAATRRRADQRRARFADDLQAAMRWAKASQPALRAWPGTRPFRVSAVVDEALGCRSFYLVPEDGRPLPRFEPGQYLTFHLPTSDPHRPLVRCYSLSDRPREDYYRVTVKLVPAPAGRPDLSSGRGSTFFHREIGPGSRLEAEAPQGGFFLDPTDRLPVVLVGGGIGITPIICMASALAYEGRGRETYVFGGFRNSREHPLRLKLSELAAEVKNLYVDVSYSQPLPGDRLGEDFHHRGRVGVTRLRAVLPSNNFRFYLCGPAGMMQSLAPELLAWGTPAEHIHYEAFGPASVRLGESESSSPCDVQFAKTGRTLRWTGAEGSLLELAEKGGVRLPSGCRAGSCGQCRVMLSAGQVTHAKKPGVELGEGECLACIARPRGEVILDA